MAIQRMDNVLIVVDDLDAVIAFFVYRLCYVRGPEGLIVGLAEQLS
jgi:hypothetical protein